MGNCAYVLFIAKNNMCLTVTEHPETFLILSTICKNFKEQESKISTEKHRQL